MGGGGSGSWGPVLRVLDLFSNGVSSLPAEVGALTGLEVLGLSSNALASVPTEVGADRGRGPQGRWPAEAGWRRRWLPARPVPGGGLETGGRGGCLGRPHGLLRLPAGRLGAPAAPAPRLLLPGPAGQGLRD